MKKLLLLLMIVPMIGFGQCISGDCENGYGTYVFSGANKGDKYVGEWRDNKMHGQGTYTYVNGDKYVGAFKHDLSNGLGTYIWGKGPNEGDKYVGEWKNDKFHGKGTYTFADGVVWKGLWRNGEFIGKK